MYIASTDGVLKAELSYSSWVLISLTVSPHYVTLFTYKLSKYLSSNRLSLQSYGGNSYHLHQKEVVVLVKVSMSPKVVMQELVWLVSLLLENLPYSINWLVLFQRYKKLVWCYIYFYHLTVTVFITISLYSMTFT